MAINQPFDTKFLKWNPNFAKSRNDQMDRKQKYIDSEVLRLCDPLIPIKTGELIRSGTRGTKIGNGLVRYIVPYAHYQYYNTAESRSYDPHRGAYWFERMKTAHMEAILEGLKKV